MKLILTLITVLSISKATFAASAAGDDPNLAKSTNMQAGTMMLGSDFNAQVPVCTKCQNQNDLKLSDTKENYQPGMAPATDSGSSSSGTGDSRK